MRPVGSSELGRDSPLDELALRRSVVSLASSVHRNSLPILDAFPLPVNGDYEAAEAAERAGSPLGPSAEHKSAGRESPPYADRAIDISPARAPDTRPRAEESEPGSPQSASAPEQISRLAPPRAVALASSPHALGHNRVSSASTIVPSPEHTSSPSSRTEQRYKRYGHNYSSSQGHSGMASSIGHNPPAMLPIGAPLAAGPVPPYTAPNSAAGSSRFPEDLLAVLPAPAWHNRNTTSTDTGQPADVPSTVSSTSAPSSPSISTSTEASMYTELTSSAGSAQAQSYKEPWAEGPLVSGAVSDGGSHSYAHSYALAHAHIHAQSHDNTHEHTHEHTHGHTREHTREHIHEHPRAHTHEHTHLYGPGQTQTRKQPQPLQPNNTLGPAFSLNTPPKVVHHHGRSPSHPGRRSGNGMLHPQPLMLSSAPAATHEFSHSFDGTLGARVHIPMLASAAEHLREGSAALLVDSRYSLEHWAAAATYFGSAAGNLMLELGWMEQWIPWRIIQGLSLPPVLAEVDIPDLKYGASPCADRVADALHSYGVRLQTRQQDSSALLAFKLAEALGSPQAIYSAAHLFMKGGRQVKKDPAKARMLLRRVNDI